MPSQKQVDAYAGGTGGRLRRALGRLLDRGRGLPEGPAAPSKDPEEVYPSRRPEAVSRPDRSGGFRG